MRYSIQLEVEIIGATDIDATDVDNMLSGALEALIAIGSNTEEDSIKLVAYDMLSISEVK